MSLFEEGCPREVSTFVFEEEAKIDDAHEAHKWIWSVPAGG